MLTAKVLPEKIFFLQISDAYEMDPPLDKEPDEQGLRPKGRWSYDYRPLPYDRGYLPVVEVTKAVLGTGFRGWLRSRLPIVWNVSRHSPMFGRTTLCTIPHTRLQSGA